MNLIETFVVFGAGYISGLSIASGYLVQWIRAFRQTAWNSARETAWSLAAIVNLCICGLMPVWLIVFFVYGDEAGSPQFWPRMLLFVFGLTLGATLVVVGLRQANKGFRAIAGNDA